MLPLIFLSNVALFFTWFPYNLVVLYKYLPEFSIRQFWSGLIISLCLAIHLNIFVPSRYLCTFSTLYGNLSPLFYIQKIVSFMYLHLYPEFPNSQFKQRYLTLPMHVAITLTHFCPPRLFPFSVRKYIFIFSHIMYVSSCIISLVLIMSCAT